MVAYLYPDCCQENLHLFGNKKAILPVQLGEKKMGNSLIICLVTHISVFLPHANYFSEFAVVMSFQSYILSKCFSETCVSTVKVMNVGVVKTGGCIGTQRAKRSRSHHANHTGTYMQTDQAAT